MLVLGLLVLLVAIALIVGAVYDGAEPATMEAFGASLDTTTAGVFFTGVGTTVLFFLGLWMLKAATARQRRMRTDRKAQRARQRENLARLEQERNELRAENERLAKQAAARSSVAGQPTTGPQQPVDLRPGGKHAEAPPTAADYAAHPANGTAAQRPTERPHSG